MICRWTTWLGITLCLVIWCATLKMLFWSSHQPPTVTVQEISPKFQASQTKRGDDPVRTSRACEQAERLYAINQYCQEHPEFRNYTLDPRSNIDAFRKFVVDKKHEIVLCQVPKAAGSFWRTMLVRGTGKLSADEEEDFNIHSGNDLRGVGLEFLHKYSKDEQAYMLENYLKVMTVRHPLERALSAYIDKFVTMHSIRDPIMDCINYINKNHRSKNNQILLPKGKNTRPSGVTIHDFVNLVLDPNSPYNPHWDSAFNLCHPCDIQYDHVIRTETIADDSEAILKILSAELNKPLELEIVHTKRNNTVQEVSNVELYVRVLEDYKHVAKADLERLKERYRQDLDVFGYNFHVPSHEALCAYDKNVKEHCC